MIQTLVLRTVPALAAAGWLDDLEGWLWSALKKLLEAFGLMWTDILLGFFKMLRDVSLFVLGILPTPSFLTQHTIGEFLGSAGPTVGWLCTQLRLGEAMAMIAAGVSFRLLRKLLTLGQW